MGHMNEIEEITGHELHVQKKYFTAFLSGLVRVGPDKVVLPSAYKKYAEHYRDFKFRDSDVVVLTYPKAGTTWMQEIIWTMCHNPDLDNPLANAYLYYKSPFFEYDIILEDMKNVKGYRQPDLDFLRSLSASANPDEGVFLKISELVPDRRVLKTHLPFSLMPDDLLSTSKVVYVVRNPKDTVASYLHHCRLIPLIAYKGSDETFYDFFCQGNLLYGSYHTHLREAWERRHDPNLLIVYFEDLKKDTLGELRKIDSFLGTNLSERQLQNVLTYTSFEQMKARDPTKLKPANEEKEIASKDNKAKNKGFFRKGKSGAWKTDLPAKTIDQIDRWIHEKVEPCVGFNLDYGN